MNSALYSGCSITVVRVHGVDVAGVQFPAARPVNFFDKKTPLDEVFFYLLLHQHAGGAIGKRVDTEDILARCLAGLG